jgi:hypothetical protein
MAEVSGWSSGAIVWAAMPPNRAAPRSVGNDRATTVAGSSDGTPASPVATGCLGTRSRGPNRSAATASNRRVVPRNQRSHTGPSGPSPVTVASRSRWISAAVPSSNGWATAIGGWHHVSP